LLLGPGLAWLFVFFVLPMWYLAKTSLSHGLFPLFTFGWAWGNFHDAVSTYQTQFIRSGLSVDILKAERVEDILPRLRAAAALVPEGAEDMAPEVARRL